jgi:anaerobic selenocysteine-containing dehydrogenase
VTTAVHRRTCPLCEAMCGLELEVEGERVVGVRGDHEDVFSHGYLCPKGVAVADVHHDPDRLKRPLRRRGGDFEESDWDEALREAADGLARVQRAHGRNAVALYLGNPTVHSYSASFATLELAAGLGTRNVYSTASVDHLPHMFAAWQMFGNRALLPVPDVDRTSFLVIVGANPLASNGSLMAAPNIARRLRDLHARGGRLVVVDPRRTQTARLADVHLAIRPGTDALFLLALVRTVLEEGPADPAALDGRVDGVEELRRTVAPYTPERVAPATGIEAEEIRRLARDFAAAPTAVCYGRLGVCTQQFGAVCCWLITSLNAITGNLDSEGGAMFTTPAADLVRLASLLGEAGSLGRWKSRVRGLPEFGGELPLAALAEEMDTPGPGRIRGLVAIAGNPALSSPNARRLDAALASLEFMVAVDFYVNETTRHANVILPGTFALERDHYDLLLSSLAVRNVARYTKPLFDPGPGAREDWRIMLDLAVGVARRRRAPLATIRAAAVRRVTPRRILAAAIRFGPHGAGLNPFGRGLTLKRLGRHGRSVDLGPLEPGRLPKRLKTKGRRILLAPPQLVADVARAETLLDERPADDSLLLITGRRQLRDNNSWMHNFPRLMRGRERCTLLVNPVDAARLGLDEGGRAAVRTRTGEVVVPVEITDEIREGAVSLPHGYGHGRPGTRLRVANAHPGVAANDVTDETLLDELSGTTRMNGIPVTIHPVEAEPEKVPAGTSHAYDTR